MYVTVCIAQNIFKLRKHSNEARLKLMILVEFQINLKTSVSYVLRKRYLYYPVQFINVLNNPSSNVDRLKTVNIIFTMKFDELQGKVTWHDSNNFYLPPFLVLFSTYRYTTSRRGTTANQP